MAEFTFNIPDDDIERVFRGLCEPAGLEITPENARQMAINHVVAAIKAYEIRKAEEAAHSNVTDVPLT